MRVLLLIGSSLAGWGCTHREGPPPADAPADLAGPGDLAGADLGAPPGPAAPPRPVWAIHFGDRAFTDQVSALAVDRDGSVIMAGHFGATIDLGGGPLKSGGDVDVVLARFSAEGKHLWSRSFGGPGADFVDAVALDGGGNVILTGRFDEQIDFGGGALRAPKGAPDIYLVKLTASGQHVWSSGFGGDALDEGLGLAVAPSGDVVLAGFFGGTIRVGGTELRSAGAADVLLARFGPDGGPAWARGLGGPLQDFGRGVALAGGDIVLTGALQGSVDLGGGPRHVAASSGAFVARYDGAGRQLWSAAYGDDRAVAFGNRVSIGRGGEVLVAGIVNGALDLGGGPLPALGGYDGFLLKLTAGGAHLRSRRFGSGDDDEVRALAIDAADGALLSGDFGKDPSFGAGPVAGLGPGDLYLTRFDGEIAPRWTAHFGGAADGDSGFAVAVGPDGSLYLGGSFKGVTDFGSGPVSAPEWPDACLIKLGAGALQ